MPKLRATYPSSSDPLAVCPGATKSSWGQSPVARMLALPLHPPQPLITACQQLISQSEVKGLQQSAVPAPSPGHRCTSTARGTQAGGLRDLCQQWAVYTNTAAKRARVHALSPGRSLGMGKGRAEPDRRCLCQPSQPQEDRAGDGRVRLASGKGTVPQLPSLQGAGLGMADNAVVPGGLQGTPWLCSGPQEGRRTSPGSGDGSKGKELFHRWF